VCEGLSAAYHSRKWFLNKAKVIPSPFKGFASLPYVASSLWLRLLASLKKKTPRLNLKEKKKESALFF
jgi:hypothetical protein